MPYVKDENNDAIFPWKGHDGVPQEAEHNYKYNYGNKNINKND